MASTLDPASIKRKGDRGITTDDMEIPSPPRETLTSKIISCVIQVHQALGAGFLEGVYRRALVIELEKQGLEAEVEREVTVYYEGKEVGKHRLDLVVEGQIILELKTVEALSRAHYAQVRSYLKATGLRLAFLINFAEDRATFRRVEGR